MEGKLESETVIEGGTSAQKLGGEVAPDFDSRFGGIEATGDSSAAVHGLLDNSC